MRPLDGIRAKLDRAETHLKVLDHVIGTYFATNPQRIVGEEETKGGSWHSPRRIEFPIFLDDPTSDPEIRGAFTKKIQALRPESHAIVDGAQPYKTSDRHHPLWLLQTLWNMDKHRALHVAGFAYIFERDLSEEAEYGFTSWRSGLFGERFDARNRTQLEAGRVQASALASAHPLQERMDAYENVTFDVTLGERGGPFSDSDEPYAGLPIRQVLRRLQRYVTKKVVDPLKPLVPS